MKIFVIICVVILSMVPGPLAFHWGSNNYTLLCGNETGSLGCSCPQNDEETLVDCNQKAISSIPTGIAFPPGIQTVTFRENRIEELLNSWFTSGSGIHTMDFSRNKIRFVAKNVFLNVKTITKLDLSHNSIWSLSVQTFEGLDNLESLDLSYNQLSNFFPDLFKSCVKLRELTLRYNPMLFLEKGSFQFLPALEVLNLESTGLSGLPPEVFQHNLNLHNVMLGSNAFMNIPLKGLLSAGNLKSLDISENSIQVLQNGSFYGLKELQIISATHMRSLVSIEAGALDGLPNLMELYFMDNPQLSSISENAFSTSESNQGKKSLSKLSLKHCALHHLPSNLIRWDELQQLDLSENPWNCDCYLSWIGDSNINIEFKKTMICADPPERSGTPVAGLGESDFTCHMLSSEAVIGLALLVAFVFVGVAALILCRCYRNKCDRCIGRSAYGHRYVKVVTSKEKVDLEWDHGAEPNSEATRT